MVEKRSAGILLPLSSLSSKYGIGTLGKEAYKFIDFLTEAGFGYWQLLPLGPTGYGDSPYQPFSSFAGSLYYVDLELLVERGLLKSQDLKAVNFGADERFCDYGALYLEREKVLRKAYCAFLKKHNIKECKNFLLEKLTAPLYNQLEFYFVFSALHHNSNIPWFEEKDPIKFKEEAGILELQQKYKEDIDFYLFAQYLFFEQYFSLKEYANGLGVKIIGDIPFYSSYDSCDCWVNAKNFSFDKALKPLTVGGCPPDAFSDDGQFWGMPTYDWAYLRDSNYAYWLERLQFNFLLYDLVRLDHFRGFEAVWSIEASEKTARNGVWVKSGGFEFFEAVRTQFPKAPIIAEDLGVITEEVENLKAFCGFPGMKVLQFAFSEQGKSKYLPHNFASTNSVVYTGTHDNATLAEWYETESPKTLGFAKQYLNAKTKGEFINACIRLALSSVSDLAVIQAQEFLQLGPAARINLPGTTGNWTWRLTKSETKKLYSLATQIRSLLDMYNRL